MYLSGFSLSAAYPDIPRGQPVSLAKATATPPYFRSGWSAKEPAGIWSDGGSASLMLHVDGGAKPLTVSLDAMAFLAHADSAQTVVVRSGQTHLVDLRYDKSSPSGVREIKIPAAVVHDGNLELDLDFPDARSPAEQEGVWRHAAIGRLRQRDHRELAGV